MVRGSVDSDCGTGGSVTGDRREGRSVAGDRRTDGFVIDRGEGRSAADEIGTPTPPPAHGSANGGRGDDGSSGGGRGDDDGGCGDGFWVTVLWLGF